MPNPCRRRSLPVVPGCRCSSPVKRLRTAASSSRRKNVPQPSLLQSTVLPSSPGSAMIAAEPVSRPARNSRPLRCRPGSWCPRRRPTRDGGRPRSRPARSSTAGHGSGCQGSPLTASIATTRRVCPRNAHTRPPPNVIAVAMPGSGIERVVPCIGSILNRRAAAESAAHTAPPPEITWVGVPPVSSIATSLPFESNSATPFAVILGGAAPGAVCWVPPLPGRLASHTAGGTHHHRGQGGQYEQQTARPSLRSGGCRHHLGGPDRLGRLLCQLAAASPGGRREPLRVLVARPQPASGRRLGARPGASAQAPARAPTGWQSRCPAETVGSRTRIRRAGRRASTGPPERRPLHPG